MRHKNWFPVASLPASWRWPPDASRCSCLLLVLRGLASGFMAVASRCLCLLLVRGGMASGCKSSAKGAERSEALEAPSSIFFKLTSIHAYFFCFEDRGQIFDQIFGRCGGGFGSVLVGFWNVCRGIFSGFFPRTFPSKLRKTSRKQNTLTLK